VAYRSDDCYGPLTIKTTKLANVGQSATPASLVEYKTMSQGR